MQIQAPCHFEFSVQGIKPNRHHDQMGHHVALTERGT